MSLFGPFVDKKGPIISAAFCNTLDALQNAMSADAGGAVTVAAPTTAEPTMLVNAATGQLGLGIQGGTGLQIAAGAVGGGVNISQDPSGFVLFNNLANQGYQFQGGDLLLSAPIVNTPSIGVTATDAAHQFAMELNNFGSPTTYAAFFYNGNSVGSINPTGAWVIPPPTSPPGTDNTLLVVGQQNSYTMTVTTVHPIVNNQSFGLLITAGTTATDYALLVRNAFAAQALFTVRGDGLLFGLGPYGRSTLQPLSDMTPDYGQFTGTLSGMSSTVSGAIRFFRVGNQVTMYSPLNLTGTSNAITMSLTGIPASVFPANLQKIPIYGVFNAGTVVLGYVQTNTNSSFDFSLLILTGGTYLSTAVFTSSGIKGLAVGATWTYSLI